MLTSKFTIFGCKNAYVKTGNAKSDLKDYTGAIIDYSKAIEIEPSNADAYLYRGDAKTELKDYSELLKIILRLLNSIQIILQHIIIEEMSRVF